MTSSNNADDCGIALAGHNPKATADGKPQPKIAGVYGNKILDNVVRRRRHKGTRVPGIIMAGGAPGAGVYDNLVEGNTAKGNGLGRLALHSHFFGPGTPAADLNGNQIIDNTVSHDGVADSPSDAEFSPADFAHGGDGRDHGRERRGEAHGHRDPRQHHQRRSLRDLDQERRQQGQREEERVPQSAGQGRSVLIAGLS